VQSVSQAGIFWQDHLTVPSFVQVDAIYALEKAIICDRIGIVKPKKMQEIQERISEILAIDSPEPLK
jgi:mRNA-degrading endonuclease toxin of MazEF toxin-antitoxin module